MVAEVVLVTFLVFAVNVAEFLPAGIDTEIGTVASDEELASLMTIPPAGAGPVSVTVPVELEPPATEAGFNVKEESPAGSMERVALADPKPMLALMVAVVSAFTALVFTTKTTLELPAGTVTDEGCVTEFESLFR